MPEKHLTTSGVNQTRLMQEETAEMGGAAVIRMVLESDKVGLSPLPTQTALFDDAKKRNRPGEPVGGWYIDPQGLRDSLMHFKPASFGGIFVNYNFPAAQTAQANAKLIFTIDQYDVAPAVVVEGGHQWLAVVGYKTNSSNNLETIFVNDSRPPLSQGTGDPADHPLAASTWTGDYYFRPVPLVGSFWNNQYATVCDPDPPKGESEVVPERILFDGARLIPRDQIGEVARKVLEEKGLLERKLFRRALGEGSEAEPLLVQDISREDSFYYLVRYQIEGKDAASVAIDARFGTFLEAIALPQPQPTVLVDPRKALKLLLESEIAVHEPVTKVSERILQRFAELHAEQDVGLTRTSPADLRAYLDGELTRLLRPLRTFRLRPEELVVHRTQVWLPAARGASLLFPYIAISSARDRYFVRVIDGLILSDRDLLFGHPLGG